MKNLSTNLFYIFIFLLPWQTRWIFKYGELNGGQWEYGTLSIFATEILLWVIIVLVASKKLKVKSNFKISKNIKKLLFIFILYLFLSLLWTINKQISAYYIFHILEAVGLIYVVNKLRLDYKKLIIIFLFAVVIQVSLGIYQFTNQYISANKWLGIAEQNPSELGVSVIQTDSRRWLRSYGSFSHPNILAGFLSLGLILNWILIIKQKVITKKELYQRLLLIFSSLIILITILFTFSRSAWVSLVITILFFIIFGYKKLENHQKNNFIKIFLYSTILIFVIMNIFSKPFITRITGEGRLEIKSNTERISYINESWLLFKQSPFLGVGIGNYTNAIYEKIDNNRISWDYQPVHNVYLLTLVELGIVGVLFLLSMFIFIIKKAKNNPYFLGLILLLSISMFDHYLWSSYFGIILFFLIFISISRRVA